MLAAKAINSGDRRVRVERVFSILRRHGWLVVPLGTAAIAATLSIVFFLPDIYRSSATVVVERRQVTEDFVRLTITRGVDTRLQRISQEIMSRSHLVSLIDKYGLYSDLRKRLPVDEVVQCMRNDIRLDLEGDRTHWSGGTVAFTISYRGTDPRTVAMVANELAAIYVAEDLKARERQATATTEVLRGKVEDIKRQLEHQEQAMADFKRTQARARHGNSEKQLGAAGNAGAASPDASAGGAPAENTELRTLAEEECLRTLNCGERVENTPGPEFRALRRNYDTTLRTYQLFSTRYEEAKLAESLDRDQKGEQFRILDPALVGERPVAPKRPHLILVGFLLSLGLVAIAAAVAETLNTSIHTADELRRLSTVPVLASIPCIVTETDRRLAARRLWLVAAPTIVGLLAIVAASYFVASQNTSLAALLS